MKTAIASVLLLLGFSACQNKPAPTPNTEPVQSFTTGLKKAPMHEYGVMHWRPKRFQGALPADYDSEEHGGKTPMRNQGGCGCCWAFGGTQTIEIPTQMFGGKTIDFSEQDLCGKYFYKCNGGDFTGEYQVKYGQTDEASCKYTATSTRCPASAKPVAFATNHGLVGQPNRSPTDEELQTAIQLYGAVAVYVSGGPRSFQSIALDADGFATQCPGGSTDHIVTLVGWKTKKGKVYFKVKNSWGTSWARGGYAYIPRGCWNLAEGASWLSVAQVPCQPPKVRLPKSQAINYGDDVRLAVRPEANVTYAWYDGAKKLADGPFLDLVARETLTVTLKASSRCGEAEVVSLVTVEQ